MPGPARPETQRESDLAVSLLGLADGALARGQLGEAESRYRRALSVDPGSTRARLGLIAVFLATQREDEASVVLAEVLETAAGAERVDALILLARVESARGRIDEAQSALSRALALDDDRYNAHQQLADLTGLAPTGEVASDEEALLRASQHPYDPAALVAGARVRIARGDEAGAVRWLENAVWLADIDRASSRQAVRMLARIDKAWAVRRVVNVHVYADESVRRERGWKMRMRLAWRSLSISLDELIRVAFVPVRIERFRSARSMSDLTSISAAFHFSVGSLPSYGLVVALTEREPPRRAGSHQLGVAGFLGREMTVRLTPGQFTSRTLIHEVLHIYGGVHVAPGIESLMNPSGGSRNLDLANQAIAWLVRKRRFGPGGIEANILPYVDIDELIAAYVETLRVNLGLRQRKVNEAREETSRYVGSALAREGARMDAHLGDVARVTGFLLSVQDRPAEAADLYEGAARLYGLRTPRGREMRELAEATREHAAAGRRR
jgi:tetratricopeptide (TPR) repeat protein